MMRRGLAFLMTAAMLLAQGAVMPVLAQAEETEQKRVLMYKQDFEIESDIQMYTFHNSNGTKALSTGTEYRTKEETGGNNYGSFYITSGDAYRRVGYQFSEDGISSGKMYVKFKFKSSANKLNGSGNTYGLFLLGNNDKLESGKTNWLSCVGYDVKKNVSQRVAPKVLDNNSNRLGTTVFVQDIWHSYEATLDLDKRSISAALYDANNNKLGEGTWTAGKRTGAYNEWPIDETSTAFKSFAGYWDIDLDDIEIYCDPIEALDTLGFVKNNSVIDAADMFTKQAQITFNHTASAVEAGAVRVDGVECTGALAADGKAYTFDLPTLVGNKEYTVTVDQTKISLKDAVVDGKGNEKGVGTKTFTFTPAGIFNYNEAFTNDVPAYNFTTGSGLGAAITDETAFAQHDELGNRYARFYSGGGTWGRCGFEFSPTGAADGQLKVHFRFRPYDKTFESFGTVLIGNCDAKFNWLPAVNVAADGTMSAAYADSKNIPEDYAFKDANGGVAKAKQDTWYTYDAVMDLDTHSIDVKVIEDGTNVVYTAKLSDINSRSGKAEWLYWPDATNFKDIGCLFPMDLDDIRISTYTAPVIRADADKVYAEAVASNQSNILLLTQYDAAGNVVAVAKESTSLADGEAVIINKEVVWADGAVKVKAFLWDNLIEMTPLEDAAAAERPAQ